MTRVVKVLPMLVLAFCVSSPAQGPFVPPGARSGIVERFAETIAVDRTEREDGLVHYEIRIYDRELTGPFPPSVSVHANLVLMDEKGECIARTPASHGVMERREKNWTGSGDQPCMVMGFAIRPSLERQAMIHLVWLQPVNGEDRYYKLPGKSVVCEELPKPPKEAGE